eukprot:3828773-Prymnesium_polylepis.1
MSCPKARNDTLSLNVLNRIRAVKHFVLEPAREVGKSVLALGLAPFHRVAWEMAGLPWRVGVLAPRAGRGRRAGPERRGPAGVARRGSQTTPSPSDSPRNEVS